MAETRSHGLHPVLSHGSHGPKYLSFNWCISVEIPILCVLTRGPNGLALGFSTCLSTQCVCSLFSLFSLRSLWAVSSQIPPDPDLQKHVQEEEKSNICDGVFVDVQARSGCSVLLAPWWLTSSKSPSSWYQLATGVWLQ